MSDFVLDCSIAAAWLFEDEATTQTDDLLEQLRNSCAFVPNLWHLELSNVLAQAERRGRITPAQISARLDHYACRKNYLLLQWQATYDCRCYL